MAQTLYSLGTWLAAPLIRLWLWARQQLGKEDPLRLHERCGHALVPRPPGALLWVHGASVGEAMTVLLLLRKLASLYPHLSFLLTTGTVTSAHILAERLPPRTLHQFVPVDTPQAVGRFLDHWRPDAALFVESELWPNLLAQLRRRDIPAALINARLSARSLHRWRYAGGWLNRLLSSFQVIVAQSATAQTMLHAAISRPVAYVGNLKYAAIPLPDDVPARTTLASQIGTRPVWLFASSHTGEEGIALSVHRALAQEFPTLLTIIAPRHPQRAEEILRLCASHGVRVAQRSRAEPPTASLYLADTLGEMGIFYRLAPITCVGGSFVPVGGHNPIEPALLGTAILFGPLMTNCAEVAQELIAGGGAQQVQDPAALTDAVRHLLRDQAQRTRMASAAYGTAMAQSQVHDRVIACLAPLLKHLREIG